MAKQIAIAIQNKQRKSASRRSESVCASETKGRGPKAVGNAAAIESKADAGDTILGQRRVDMNLVESIVRGDAGSFDQLHRLYRDRIYRFALKRLRDTAEADDVCQDVFMQVFKCIGSYQGRSSLLTWMFGITHHQICRRFRRRSHVAFSLDDYHAFEVAAKVVSADQQLDASRVLEDCDRVLDEKVNENQRNVFKMRYAENYSMGEIADEMGKSNQAIKISIFRTRRTLAENVDNLDALMSA
jgi:RNA polymerase sigma-70 factor (ECF subfamily)